MRSLLEMDTIQIEILNDCNKFCSNCTRFHGNRPPFYMTFEQFKQAVDSLVEYPKMVGVMGGSPTMHPLFAEFCEYLRSKIPPERCGLWDSFPLEGRIYREVICKTFKHVFLNDHSRNDVFHHPHLVAIEEVIKDENLMYQCINKCWAQESWSATINPKGAWFCEMAGSMSLLFDEGEGWPVEPGWWNRIPVDFKSQIDMFCRRCGMPASLPRRASNDGIIDISPKNYERLKDVLPVGRCKISDLKTVTNPQPMASYKDFNYRNQIAKRYDCFLIINNQQFWSIFPYKNCDYDYIKVNDPPITKKPTVKSQILDGEISLPSCQECRQCCDGTLYDHVPISEEEFNKLSKYNGHGGIYKFGYGYRMDQRNGCSFLQNNKCSVYEDRPDTCKRYVCEKVEVK